MLKCCTGRRLVGSINCTDVRYEILLGRDIYKTFFKVLEQQHQDNINILKTFQREYQEHTNISIYLKYTTNNTATFF